jgi:hypothetical protein
MARKKEQQSSTPKKPGRFAQIRQVYTAARQVDRLIGWWMLLAFVATLTVAVALGALWATWWYGLILGIPLALLAATIVMSRRAERAAYRAIEGQPGSAGAALGALRRGWFFDQQPVALDGARGTRPEDMAGAAFVFRAVGRPGVVLVAEGPTGRTAKLLETERKKVARVAPGVPVHLLTVGDGEGQVPVRKLVRHVSKLGRKVKGAELTDVLSRLKAIDANRPNVPLPKGPVPTSMKGLRGQMRGR